MGHPLLADQCQAIVAFFLAEFSFNDVALPLVFKNCFLSTATNSGSFFWPTEAGATQPNAIALSEGTIRSCPVDLVSTDYFWVMNMPTPIGSRLSLEIFSFVVGLVAEPVKECKLTTCHRSRGLGSECNAAPGLAANDRPGTSLIETDDPIGGAPIAGMAQNSLLTGELADHQQLVAPMPTCYKRAVTAGDHGINTGQITIQMTQLLLNGLADPADARPLFSGHGQELLSGFLSMRARFVAKGRLI